MEKQCLVDLNTALKFLASLSPDLTSFNLILIIFFLGFIKSMY